MNINRALQQNKMVTEAKQARFQPKTILQILLFLAVFFTTEIMASFFVSFFTTGGVFIKAMTTGVIKDGFDAVITYTVENAQQMLSTSWATLISLLSTLIRIIACVIFCVKIEKRSAMSMGFHKKEMLKKYGIGYFVGILMLAATAGLNALFQGMQFSVNTGWMQKLPYILLFLCGYMIQGLSEEVLVRGYLQMTLTTHRSVWFSVLFSALIFAAMHLANPGMGVLPFVNLFLFGVFMSLTHLKTDSIWTVGAIHAAWNFAQGHLFGISVSGTGTRVESVLASSVSEGKELINGGTFGVEGGICTSIALIIGIAIVLYLLYRDGKQLSMESVSENPSENA